MSLATIQSQLYGFLVNSNISLKPMPINFQQTLEDIHTKRQPPRPLQPIQPPQQGLPLWPLRWYKNLRKRHFFVSLTKQKWLMIQHRVYTVYSGLRGHWRSLDVTSYYTGPPKEASFMGFLVNSNISFLKLMPINFQLPLTVEAVEAAEAASLYECFLGSIGSYLAQVLRKYNC